jgi:hypothetical protein
MILDKELIFADKQSVTAAGASSNIVDQGAAGDSYDALWLVVNVATAITGNLGFDLETDDNSEFSGATKLLSIAAADRTVTGNIFKGRLPKGCERYLRILWSGTVSAGNMTAFLAKDVAI